MNQGYEFKRTSIRDIQVVGKRIILSRVNATDVTYTLEQAEDVVEIWKAIPRIGLQDANLDKFKACIAQLKGDKRQALSQEEQLLRVLQPLVNIANAYDNNELDDEARRFWGPNLEHKNTKNPEETILYSGRSWRELLTLQHCFNARSLYRKLQQQRGSAQTQ